jgi:hypothetical protein
LPDLRFSTSLPRLVVPQNGRPIGPEGLPIVASPGNCRSGSGAPAADRHPDVSIPSSSKLPPPTVISPASDNMGEMWRIIDDRAENTSKTEKIMNRITDTASASCVFFSLIGLCLMPCRRRCCYRIILGRCRRPRQDCTRK